MQTWACGAVRVCTVVGLCSVCVQGATFGVSRLTSGSHLMAFVLAQQRGWDTTADVRFTVEGTFSALRESVRAGRTAAFMWETCVGCACSQHLCVYSGGHVTQRGLMAPLCGPCSQPELGDASPS